MTEKEDRSCPAHFPEWTLTSKILKSGVVHTIGSSRRRASSFNRSSIRAAIYVDIESRIWVEHIVPLDVFQTWSFCCAKYQTATIDETSASTLLRTSRYGCMGWKTKSEKIISRSTRQETGKLITGIEFISPSNKIRSQVATALHSQAEKASRLPRSTWSRSTCFVAVGLSWACQSRGLENDPAGKVRDQRSDGATAWTTSSTRSRCGRGCRKVGIPLKSGRARCRARFQAALARVYEAGRVSDADRL